MFLGTIPKNEILVSPLLFSSGVYSHAVDIYRLHLPAPDNTYHHSFVPGTLM